MWKGWNGNSIMWFCVYSLLKIDFRNSFQCIFDQSFLLFFRIYRTQILQFHGMTSLGDVGIRHWYVLTQTNSTKLNFGLVKIFLLCRHLSEIATFPMNFFFFGIRLKYKVTNATVFYVIITEWKVSVASRIQISDLEH